MSTEETPSHLRRVLDRCNVNVFVGPFIFQLWTWWLLVFQAVALGTVATAWTGTPWYVDTAIWVLCFIVAAGLTWLESVIVSLVLKRKR
jgi:hypothetical protein